MSTNYRNLLKSKNQVSEYKVSTPKQDEELKELLDERGRKHPSYFAAQKLLKQIGEQDEACLHWLFSSINRLLNVNREMSLFDFYEELKKLNPEQYEQFTEFCIIKEFKIV
jgi:hypothetical protein